MINWGLANQGGFQNALAQGFGLGQKIRQRREEKEYKNALASGDWKGVAQYDPRLARQMQQDERAQAAAEVEQRNSESKVVRQLLFKAEENPAQALAAAQSMGIDPRALGAPDISDPNFQPWVDQQLFIMDALESPQGQAALSTAGKQAADEGLQPGTEPFQLRVRELVNAGLQKIMATQPGGTIVGFDTRTGQGTVLAGPGEAPAATEIGGVQYYQNPETGKWYDNPQEAGLTGGTAGNGGGGFPGN